LAAAAADPRIDALMQDLWRETLAVHPLEAGLLVLPVGLAFLLYGFRLYKWLVIVVYTAIGLFAGLALAAWLGFNPILCVIAGAIVLGVLAWPLHRAAWAVLGGAFFAALAAIFMLAQTREGWPVGVVAAAAFIGGLIATLLLMRPLIIIVTACCGAVLVVQALLRLALLVPPFEDPIRAVFLAGPLALGSLVVIQAVLGIFLQWRDTAGTTPAGMKPARKKSAEAGE
jgi:hypothetical protein